MNKKHLFLLFFMLILTTGCVSSAFHSGKRRPPAAPHIAMEESFEERYTFLEENKTEDKGYGLYSYVLFKSRPTGLEKALYLEMISEILRRSNQLDKVKDQKIPVEELHITYFLVISKPVENKLFKGSEKEISERSQWILENYDYRRASHIIRKAGLSGSNGPFILSSFEPRASSQDPITTKHLVQNFEKVPSERKNLIRSWVNTFFKHANSPQKWDAFSLAQLGLSLRTNIAIAASGIPSLKKELKEWVQLIEPFVSS